ncbi:MAG: hypothetical protein K0U72_12980 [Gammaproteobacteria bacterium]|nr:hypothetical protein [Gammaproteobacteria bacterium]
MTGLLLRCALVASILLFAGPLRADEAPRTGYFKISTTPQELLGERGAEAVSSLFEADQALSWQLYVPPAYDPEKPAGAMVFVGFGDWGGGKKAWNRVLEENNLIWIGPLNAGDDVPVNERMVKAMLAQAVLEQTYKIDMERFYLFGYSGGAHIAAILATTKPELYKGAVYLGEALRWTEPPSKIELLRKNRFVFMTGGRDKDRKDIQKTAEVYRAAGVDAVEFVSIPNIDRKMPGPGYFEAAVEFLDSRKPSD